MLIESKFWRRISAGVIAVAALSSLAGSLCLAADYGRDQTPGARQIEYKGKLWPPFYRPPGKEAKFVHQYHYAHYWPYPQNCEDRSSVSNALNMQMANGWIEATTLFSYHFDPETHELNSSGLAHLEYILFRVPPQRRSVFVQLAPTPQVDQAHLASVQESVAGLLQNNSVPPIALRRARAYGTSAEEVDLMSRKYMGVAPVPRLPISGAGSIATPAK
jgi:hypothetical protein